MALENLRGRVAFKFDEIDFDVDQIVGVKNIKIKDADELARVAMTSRDPEFAKSVRPGYVLIGNHNFGYGHPHYPPMIAMRRGLESLMRSVLLRAPPRRALRDRPRRRRARSAGRDARTGPRGSTRESPGPSSRGARQ